MLTPELVFGKFTKLTESTYVDVALKESVKGETYYPVAQISFDQVWLWTNRSARDAAIEPDFKVICDIKVLQTVKEHRLPWRRWHCLEYREMIRDEPMEKLFNEVIFKGQFYPSARIDLRDFKLYCYDHIGGVERSEFLELNIPEDNDR